MNEEINNAFLEQPAGQQVEASAEGVVPEIDVTKPLTMEDFGKALDAFKAKFREEVREEVKREAQSFSDKHASRFDKSIAEANERVDAALAFLKSIGEEVPEEKEKKMRRQAVDDAIVSRTASEPPPAQEDDQEQEPVLSPTMIKAVGIAEAFGVNFTKDDPEMAELEAAAKSLAPDEYLKVVKKCCQSKSERLNESPEKAAVRVPGLVAGQSGGNSLAGKSTDECLELAFR